MEKPGISACSGRVSARELSSLTIMRNAGGEQQPVMPIHFMPRIHMHLTIGGLLMKPISWGPILMLSYPNLTLQMNG